MPWPHGHDPHGPRSKEHQRAAWVGGYKVECEALVRCAPRVPPPTVRLAARILWRRER